MDIGRPGGRLLWGWHLAGQMERSPGKGWSFSEEGDEPRMSPGLCAHKTARRLACQVL